MQELCFIKFNVISCKWCKSERNIYNIKELLQKSQLAHQSYNNMNKQESYAFFVDNSGSVGQSKIYWGAVETIFTSYAKDISHYYLWNSTCGIIDKKTMSQKIVEMKGTGGTSPEHVAEEIVKKQFTNIILVTDGEVGDHSVKRCDQIFENASKTQFKIKKSICYVIGSYNEPNLSVTCPFARFSECQVFSQGGDQPLKSIIQYTAEDFKILDGLEEISLENFEAKYDTIEQLIIAQNMGKEANEPLKNQLVSLKTKLIKELSKKLGKKEDYSSKIRSMLKEQKLDSALEMVSNMATKYLEESGTGELEKKLNDLIALCGDLRGQYSVGQIKSNKMATAQQAKTGTIDANQEVNELSKNPIECPIIMDEAVPQILIDECEPFLLNVEKCIVDDINACPLRILNYPFLKAKFKACLSTYTGVKYCDKLLKNPFTQNRLLGSIPLGCHKSHVTVGNHTIAKMVAGGKVMGNLNMYYAVIWILVNEGIEFLNPIKANLEEQLHFRLTSSRTMASLSGLSQFVSTQIDTDIAVWYCLNSGYLNQPVKSDAFRFHLYDVEYLLKITQSLNYPVHQGFIRHFLRTKALHYFLERFKRLDVKQRKCFKSLFKGLYQGGFLIDTSKIEKKVRQTEVCPEFIPTDGPASEEQVKAIRARLPTFCAELTNEDLLYVYSQVDGEKQFTEIFMDYNVVIPALPVAETNWKYGLKHYPHKVQVSEVTGRPLAQLEGQSWQEWATKTFGFAEKQQLFKGCRYICDFIVKYSKKPTREEMAVFYYNRYVESGKKNTLPFEASAWIDELLASYQPVFPQGYSIGKIVSALKQSGKRSRRIQMQAQ